MSDSIFLVGDDGAVTEAASIAYDAEAELQELLARNVHLLPGAQINQENPRRWLLIKREAGVPDHEGGGGWWSIDHLAVDQDAVPTFVEVKRASDTRARREVCRADAGLCRQRLGVLDSRAAAKLVRGR